MLLGDERGFAGGFGHISAEGSQDELLTDRGPTGTLKQLQVQWL